MTELDILNSALVEAVVNGLALCSFECDDVEIPPGITFRPRVHSTSPTTEGAFLYVEREFVNDVRISLRLTELTKQAGTWGTSLPVVYENEFITTETDLIGIPANRRYRVALRIYGLPEGSTGPLRVRIYETTLVPTPYGNPVDRNPRDTLLTEKQVTLEVPGGGPGLHPLFAELSISSIPEVFGDRTIRIEITPAAGVKYWPMVSITHNESHHVTIITSKTAPSN